MNETELIQTHQAFVEGLAHLLKRQLKMRVDVEDLVAYGYEGLLQAWRRYDPTSKSAFKSFAYYRIRGAMLDGCRKEGWAPRKRKRQVKQIQAINANQQTNLEHEQQPAAKTLSESIERVSETIAQTLTILFVEHEELEHKIVTEATQEEGLEQEDHQKRILSALSQLDEKERDIIVRYHFQDESLKDIGKDWNISTSWCSRVHSRALLKMRNHLLDSDLPNSG